MVHHQFKYLEMSLERVCHNYAVVQIYEADFPGQSGKNQINRPVEQRRRVGQTEAEYLEPER